MLAQSHARKPAPPLAARGMWLRLHGGADAFGSALGDAVVGSIAKGDSTNGENKNGSNGPVSGTGLRVKRDPWGNIGANLPESPLDDPLTRMRVFGLAEPGQDVKLAGGSASVRSGDTLWQAGQGDPELVGRYALGMGIRQSTDLRAGQTYAADWNATRAEALAAASRLTSGDAQRAAAREAAKAAAAQAATASQTAGSLNFAQALGLQSEAPVIGACLRSDWELPIAGQSMRAWDGVSGRMSPAEQYLRSSLGGLDPVRGNDFGLRVAQQLPDAAAQEVGGLIIGAGTRLLRAGTLALRGEQAVLRAELQSTMSAGLSRNIPTGAVLEGLRPTEGISQGLIRERVISNISASQSAREASNFSGLSRYETSYNFYRQSGYDANRTLDNIRGIDFNYPVDVVKINPGTQVIQYQIPGGSMGNYYALPGTAGNQLGFYTSGRQATTYVATDNITALRSTASSTIDDWSMKEYGWQIDAPGGATQFFTRSKAWTPVK